MSFNPYLFFSDGKCREAFEHYNKIFGGDLQIMTNADTPEGVDSMPGAAPEHVMHAAITVGGGLLMGSDDPTGDGGPKVGVAVAYTASDTTDGKRVFEALAEGGAGVILADEVGLSRSGFAARFAALVGETPLAYLTHLRMRRASLLLRKGASLADVSRRTGYSSEASFSYAFRQWAGVAPGEWRRRLSPPAG